MLLTDRSGGSPNESNDTSVAEITKPESQVDTVTVVYVAYGASMNSYQWTVYF